MDDPSSIPATSDASQPVDTPCSVHPFVRATFQCHECSKSFCNTCRFNESDGHAYCTGCMVARMESQKPRLDVPKNLVQQMAEKTDAELLAMLDVPEDWTPEAFAAMTAEARNRNLTEVTSGIGGASIPKVAPVREGVMCGQHSQVQATQQCRRCGAFMCATCDFEFPNNLHLCPACACKSEDGLDPRRKKFVIWSMALAAWTSLGMACLISGALRGLANSRADAAVLGYALLLFVLGPGLTGLTLGLSAKYQRRANPPSIWIAIAWNAILVASFIILMIIGIARS